MNAREPAQALGGLSNRAGAHSSVASAEKRIVSDKDRHLALRAKCIHVEKGPLAGDTCPAVRLPQNVEVVTVIDVGHLVFRTVRDELGFDVNAALVDALRDWLGVKKSQVELTTGPTSRDKMFLIRGMTPDELTELVESKLG